MQKAKTANFVPLRKTDLLGKQQLLTRVLYAEIESLCKKSGVCFATNAYFADEYNVSTKTVSTHLSKLKELGLIETSRNATKFGAIRILKLTSETIPPVQEAPNKQPSYPSN